MEQIKWQSSAENKIYTKTPLRILWYIELKQTKFITVQLIQLLKYTEDREIHNQSEQIWHWQKTLKTGSQVGITKV